MVRVVNMKSRVHGLLSRCDHKVLLFSVGPSSTPLSHLSIATWSASCQLGVLTVIYFVRRFHRLFPLGKGKSG